MKNMKCNIDGNCLCIFTDNFINLQESDAVFIELSKDQIRLIEELK